MEVLKFFADWCVPCKTLTNILKDSDLPITSINIETDPETAIKYSIRQIPMLVFVDEDGKELYRQQGVVSVDRVKEIINDISRDIKNKQAT